METYIIVFLVGVLTGGFAGVYLYHKYLDKPEVQNNTTIKDKRRFRLKFRK